MNDREALLELLARYGLGPATDGEPTDVVLRAKEGGVEGYDGLPGHV